MDDPFDDLCVWKMIESVVHSMYSRPATVEPDRVPRSYAISNEFIKQVASTLSVSGISG